MLINEKPRTKFCLSLSLNSQVLLIILVVSAYFGYQKYAEHKTEQADTSVFILSPKVNDVYFLETLSLDTLSGQKQPYTLAKVVRVSEDGIAVVHGRFSYQWKYAVVNSIQYGDLSHADYFKLIPDYLPFNTLKKMKANNEIYLIKRPIQNKLYGNVVSL